MVSNKKILITGASGGIGDAICNKFEKNDNVFVLTSSSDEKLLNLKNKFGDRHFFYKVDFSNKDDVNKVLDEISNTHKDISIIISNAGATRDNLIFRMKSNQWSEIIQTNLNSNFQILQSLLPNMLANKYGKI